MEFLKTKYLLPFILTAALPVGCGYDDFGEPTLEKVEPMLPNATIGFIRSVCGEGVYNVTDDLVLGGYVTANDRGGNIYRSFFIEDGTGAVEVRAGMYSLHNVYVRGRFVSVTLRDLSVSLDNGTLRIGSPPSGGYTSVEYIDSWAVAADYLFPADEFRTISPLPLTVRQLDREYCGRLVRLGYMKLKKDEDGENETDREEGDGEISRSGWQEDIITWAYPAGQDNTVPQAAYRYFEDLEGNMVAVYTSGYADFAGRAVPDGLVSLTGILGYGNTGRGESYIIRLRDADDAVLQLPD